MIGTPELIQANSGTGGITGITFTVPATAVPEGALIFNATTIKETQTTFSVSDTGGSSYTTTEDLANETAGNTAIGIGWAANVSALSQNNTITSEFSDGRSDAAGIAVWVSGVHTSNPLQDSTLTENGATSTPSSGTVNVSAEECVLIGVVGGDVFNAGLSVTEDSDFNSITTVQSGAAGGDQFMHFGYRVVASAGGYTYAPDLGGNIPSFCGVFAFNNAVAEEGGSSLVILRRRRM